MVVAAYFLHRRDVLAIFALTAVGFGVALLVWVEPDARMIQWVSVVVATAVLAGLVVALQHLTSVLESRTRRGDVVGRLGGEEFAIVLAGTDGPGAETYAESLRAALADASEDSTLPPFTVSIGVAELIDGETRSEPMLSAADRALYAAKAAGRNRSVLAAATAAPARG